MMKIAIVGGGAAGTACATRLRRLNENDEIVIFEKAVNWHCPTAACRICFPALSKTAKRLSAPRRNR